MRIGLVDVDGHNFPNLALMKLSAWHKAQGDHVEMLFPMAQYDRVYMSKVFDFTPDFVTCIDAKEIIKGGTGYDMRTHLPDEVESIYPDYSLYGITNTAYGYMTRGCPRNCPFCIVGEKEGLRSRKVANLDEFWNGQKNIVLLDPNITACPDRIELLSQLADSQAWVGFTQGLDIRLMTEDVAEIINKIKVKMLHFAWDRRNEDERIIENLTKFKQITKLDFRRLRVYVLVNYETTIEEDLYRIYKLKELGYDPYVMIFNKESAPRQIKRMARWVNNKFIFRVCERFEDYEG